MFSAYLWGIETVIIEIFRKISYTFSAYLWGIETPGTSSNLNHFLILSFQPTYEELKPAWAQPFTASRSCFQPTYEELKLYQLLLLWTDRTVFSLPMRNWNGWIWPLGVWAGCFSLPMRYWNMIFPHFPFFWSGFSAYLCGIETLYHSLQLLALSQFSAYLWGIETKLHINSSLILPRVFSLPMRNWNFKGSVNSNSSTKCFQPTYEELKHRFPLSFLLLSLVFSLPMRNWNIEAILAISAIIKVFSLPMRNWNP